MRNKTFRLFISSTFSDFTREREVMQTNIFPELEDYCSSLGFQFQAIDLRWGVNEEAQLDQKTIEICLKEVNICKHFPHPNFLIMVGNRYGWIPLPYAFEKNEFEKILNFFSDDISEKSLLTEWYQHDQNHLTPDQSTVYVIKSREGRFAEYEHWQKTENQIRRLLQKAVSNIDSILDKEKYFKSATEHEVIEGVCPYCKQAGISKEPKKNSENDFFLDMEYVYGFIRNIMDKGTPDAPSLFFDDDIERIKQFKSNIKKTLKDKNLLELKTETISKNLIDEQYLKIFKDQLLKYLKGSIKKQVERISQGTAGEAIKAEHFAFKQKRLEVFVGREETLRNIAKYISGPSNVPLIIYGKSGMGKTSLMAKAIDKASRNKEEKLIYRFVGATEKSSNLRSLLISIVKEIDTRLAEELVKIFNDDIFSDRVAKIFAEIKSNTVIFIDAIDQLRQKSSIKWLPDRLSTHLKLVISVLDDDDYIGDSAYLDLFKVKYDDKNLSSNLIQLNPLKRKDGSEILEKLLFLNNRTITINQEEYILGKFEESGYSPLYLIIAFEEIKQWKSFDTDFNVKLKRGIVPSIEEFIKNLAIRYHHQEILVNSVFGYLVSSKNGLSEKEMIDILSADKKVMEQIENQFHQNLSGKLPVAPWARLYSQLSPFLIQKMSDNVSLISLFHRQFNQAVSNNILSNKYLKKLFHSSIADYFIDQPLITSEGIYNLRKLSEQAYQLFHSDQPRAMLDLFEQNYINIKYELGRFYECLFEIEQAFILIDQIKEDRDELKNRLFVSLIGFFSSYSGSKLKTFDFELIHAYFIYRKRSNFYKEFLEYVSDKDRLNKHFNGDEVSEEYYLLFLSRQVNFLRRYGKLTEAAAYVNEIIDEYAQRISTENDNTEIYNQLSTSYYELGYILYLSDKFEQADEAFIQSVAYAQKTNNLIKEWITRCVMTRILMIGGLTSIDEFDKTLDKAYEIFQQFESTNDVAKRWLMVIQHHKFEIAYKKLDLEMITQYYNYLRTNEWIKDFDIALDLYQAQLKFVSSEYKGSIESFKKYLASFSDEALSREESIVEVFHDLGYAYLLNNESENARLTWERGLSFNDLPGNQVHKRNITRKMAKHFGEVI